MEREKIGVWAFSGFLVLSFFGAVLRYMQLFPLPGFNYMFLLHAHSHFAFAGWTFFALAALLAASASATNTTALKRLGIATLLSSYGMLIAFSYQGYKAVSIAFSTLFILVTYRFTYLMYRQYKKEWNLNVLSSYLVWAALAYLGLSSLGPFALGPLMSAGMRGTTVYQNAIYYYLHFQMNGWMMLGSLALVANSYLFCGDTIPGRIKGWVLMFILSNVPLFALFTLWSDPQAWVWAIALIGSLAQLTSWFLLCLYFAKQQKKFSFLAKTALLAISVKLIFQLLVCIPLVAEWAFMNRNLIIGYVHLITLGCISPLIIDRFIQNNYFKAGTNVAKLNVTYVAWVALYLLLLFFQPLLSLFMVGIPYFQMSLLLISIGFVILSAFYLRKL